MPESTPSDQYDLKKFNFHKVFATVGIILIAIIIIGVGIWYFVQRSQDNVPDEVVVTKISTSSAKPKTSTSSADKSDWKTYTNKNGGYEVKYPMDWLVNTPSCEPDYASVAPNKDLLGICASGKIGLVSFSRTEVGQTINKQIALYNPVDYLNFKKETVVSSKPTTKITATQKVDNPGREVKGTLLIIYLVDFGNRTLVIQYRQSPTDMDYSKTFENIYSTLKFL